MTSFELTVFPFDQAPTENDPKNGIVAIDITGGKGLSLARMTKGGFNVPQGFFVATKVRRLPLFIAISFFSLPFSKREEP